MKDLKVSEIIKAGVSVNSVFSALRVGARQFNGLMDPIIGFDHFQLSSDVFGPHPHAGMSATTYLFEDSAPFRNLDSIGTDLVIQPGSLQWTYAGSGVVHNEFPETDGQKIDGLQLFINIPASKKQLPPASYHINSRDIPEINTEGVRVRVVSGNTGALANHAETPEALTFLDIFLSAQCSFAHELPAGWNGTVYLISGKLDFKNSAGNAQLTSQNVVSTGLSAQEETLTFTATEDAHLLFISGQALQEEIFQLGSFAMGSPDELTQTIAAYQQGRMGFIEVTGTERKVVLPH